MDLPVSAPAAAVPAPAAAAAAKGAPPPAAEPAVAAAAAARGAPAAAAITPPPALVPVSTAAGSSKVVVANLKSWLSSRLRAKGKRAPRAEYRNQRTDDANGKTVQEAVGSWVPDRHGDSVLYKYGDIAYDINSGMLSLGDGTIRTA